MPMSGSVVAFTPRVAPVEPDENVASIIEVLQDQLALAREGKLRSLAVVSVTADGGAVGTQWSCTPSDVTTLIGKLSVLTHDLMSERQ